MSTLISISCFSDHCIVLSHPQYCYKKILKELIVSALQNGPLKKAEIFEATKHAFPDVLTEEKQYKKLSNLLQQMKRAGIVGVRGSAVHAEWFLAETK